MIAPVIRTPLRALKPQYSAPVLASFDRRSENVRVLPVIITELEFGNIERHVFPAHFVECTDHAALENRPETLDGLSVDRSDDVLAPGMVNSGMGEVFAKAFVAGPLVSAELTLWETVSRTKASNVAA
jgi:hypothetical protein